MFMQRGVLAAAACATTPLLALGSKPPVAGDAAGETRAFPGHSASGSAGWEDHAAAFDHLGRSQFASEIGTSFKVMVEGSSQPVWLALVGVEDLPALVPVN